MSQQQHSVLLGLGANLPFGASAPRETLKAALEMLARSGLAGPARSKFYETEPVPRSDQPNFIKCVLSVTTDLPPLEVLSACQQTEQAFGRERNARWSARTLDIDILAYDNLVLPGLREWHRIADGGPDQKMPTLVLPHPRVHRRAFVLVPLAELMPEWRHPLLDRTAIELLSGISHAERATVRQIDCQ